MVDTTLEMAIRIVLALLLGLGIGIERESRDQPAGARTHCLVCVGAALFGIISVYGFLGYSPATDPSRVAAQVVTGIGFLGAGAIIRLGVTIRGLTTAASLWVVAAVGLAVGIGMYLIATLVAVLAVAVLVLVRIFHAPIRKLFGEHRAIVVQLDDAAGIAEVVRIVTESPLRLVHIDVEEEVPGERLTVTAAVVLKPQGDPERLIPEIAAVPGVRGVEMAS